MLVAPLALAALCVRQVAGHGAVARQHALIVASAMTVTLGWCCLSVSHMIIQACFMVRPLSWMIVFLCGYGCVPNLERQRRV